MELYRDPLDDSDSLQLPGLPVPPCFICITETNNHVDPVSKRLTEEQSFLQGLMVWPNSEEYKKALHNSLTSRRFAQFQRVQRPQGHGIRSTNPDDSSALIPYQLSSETAMKTYLDIPKRLSSACTCLQEIKAITPRNFFLIQGEVGLR